jgi:hypothetical protein
MRDKYNLNLLPKGSEEAEYEDVVTAPSIPGMGFGDQEYEEEEEETLTGSSIPGLGFINDENKEQQRKVPYAKPIPKQFQQQWNGDTKRMSPSLLSGPNSNANTNGNLSNQMANQSLKDMPPPAPSTPPSLLGSAPMPRGFSNAGQSLLGPMPHRFGPRGFIPPPGMPSHPSGNPQLNIPPFMMGSRMGGPPLRNMIPPPHPPHHQMPDHNIHHDNYHIHNQNHRPNNALDMPLSPRQAMNRDTDERFNQMNHFDEDLRHSHDFQYEEQFDNRQFDDRPYNHRPDMRFKDRHERRDNHFDERQFDDNMRPFDDRHMPRDDQRREDHWRREDNEMPFRPNFNSDKDFRNRKRMWKEGPGDQDMIEDGPHYQQPAERMWNRISPNGNLDRDRDRIY